MDDFEPCPWCGSERIVPFCDGSLVAAMCGDCHAQGPLVSDWDKAAAQWDEQTRLKEMEQDLLAMIAAKGDAEDALEYERALSASLAATRADYEKAFLRIARAAGIKTPMQLTALAENDEERTCELLARFIEEAPQNVIHEVHKQAWMDTLDDLMKEHLGIMAQSKQYPPFYSDMVDFIALLQGDGSE